jgi:hypothetical protein
MVAALSSKTFQIMSLLLVLALAGWVWTRRATLKPEGVSIGMPTSAPRLSWKTFSYNDQGHFGAKTQFESKNTDAFGGTYSLHCRDGKVYAVEINYPAGLEKDKTEAIISRVTGHDPSKSEEHDAKELTMKGCEKPSEYYYFDKGKIGVQLDYGGTDKNRVSRIYCWSA